MRAPRPINMPRSALLLVASMLGTAVLPFPQPPASASCAAPTLDVPERMVIERGSTVTIHGQYFVNGCRDSISCSVGPGCDSCEYDEPPPTAMQDISLRLRQGDRTWVLSTEDAGATEGQGAGEVTWTFQVPDGVKPGAARLVADVSQPVSIRVQ